MVRLIKTMRALQKWRCRYI